jgi:hypothetical protein
LSFRFGQVSLYARSGHVALTSFHLHTTARAGADAQCLSTTIWTALEFPSAFAPKHRRAA